MRSEGILVLLLFEVLTYSSGMMNSCSLLSLPPNGVISRCTKGSLKGSRCTVRCKYGFRQEQTTRTCTCYAFFCVWEGTNPFCDVQECEKPDNEHGKVTIVDQWPGGFAGLIEFRYVPPVLIEGWSIVLKFDRSLGQGAQLSSWSAEPTSVGSNHDSFTLSSPQYGFNSSQKRSLSLRTLFVVTAVEGETPTSGYIGMYDRRIADVTCYAPTSGTQEIDVLPPFAASTLAGMTIPATSELPITPTTAAATNTTQAATAETSLLLTTTYTASATTSQPIEGIRNLNKTNTDKESTNSSETEETTQSVATITTRNSAEFSLVQPYLTSVDGMGCRLQRGNMSYRTQNGWIDRNKAYFSGSAIVRTTAQTENWMAVLVFERPLSELTVWRTVVTGNQSNGCLWKLGPKSHDFLLNPGVLDINFIAVLKEHAAVNPLADVYLCSRYFETGDPIRLPVDGVIEPAPPIDVLTSIIITTTTTAATPIPTLPTTLASGVHPRPSQSSVSRCDRTAPMGVRSQNTRQSRPRWKRSRDGTKYDYNELLVKSILFYEAQRSGSLPSGRYKRVPWRGNSMLKDGCSIGVDLSRGWFDAGDYVKFTFPTAAAVTTLAWGGIEFRSAYRDAGILTRFTGSFKWPVEWLIKAHTDPYELVALVGDIKADHESWGRPEDWNLARPVYKITKENPGSELAAETAAALASASILLKKSHRQIASNALAHARQLYDFATKYRGDYHDAVPQVMDYYRSWSGDTDELVWAACWLYKATNQTSYLDDAQRLYSQVGGPYLTEGEYSWDRKMIGAQVLLANLTGEGTYRAGVQRFMNKVMRSTRRTPKQMIWIRRHAPNRYAANIAMIALMASNLEPPLPDREGYLAFAKQQIHLLLGDAGRSYVIGVGKNYPLRPHHRASSCPPPPAVCNRPTTYFDPRPNHYILYGALVGGPDAQGNYDDSRENYVQGEVALDYNAGYQSAVAGLKFHAMKSRPKRKFKKRRRGRRA